MISVRVFFLACVTACVFPFIMHSCKKKADDNKVLTYFIDADPHDKCLYTGDEIHFNVAATQSLPPGTNYYWDFGDNSYSSEKAPIHQYSAPGVYSVILVINNRPDNKAESSLVIHSHLASAYTMQTAGMHTWSGYRTSYPGDTVRITDSAIGIEAVDAGGIKCLGDEMRIHNIDSGNHVISYFACTAGGSLDYYYSADSMVYNYNLQTGKVKTIVSMHTQ